MPGLELKQPIKLLENGSTEVWMERFDFMAKNWTGSAQSHVKDTGNEDGWSEVHSLQAILKFINSRGVE